MIIIYFFYGLAFLAMAAIIFTMPKKSDLLHLSRNLWLVGVFGVTHGLNEWVDLFILRGFPFDPGILKIIGAFLLPFSYIFLVIFGCRVILSEKPRFKWLRFVWIFLVLAVIAAFILNRSLLVTAIASRYFTAFPGALLTAAALFLAVFSRFRAIRFPKIVSLSAVTAVIVFAAYAVLSGLIVPQADFFPASVINYSGFSALFGFPVQIARAVCAIILSFCFFGMTGVFSAQEGKIMLRGGIRHKFTLIIFAYMFIFALVGIGLTYFWTAELITKMTIERHRVITDNLADDLEESFNAEVDFIKTLSASPFWKNALQKAAGSVPAGDEYLQDLSLRLSQIADEKKEISEISVLDTSGRIVAASRKIDKVSAAAEAWRKGAFEGAKTGEPFADILLGHPSGGQFFVITVPIAVPIKEESGSLIGVCVALVDINTLFKPQLAYFESLPNICILIIDSQDRLIYGHSGLVYEKGFGQEHLHRLLGAEKKAGFLSIPPHREKRFASFAQASPLLLSQKGIHLDLIMEEDAAGLFSGLEDFIVRLITIVILLTLVMLPIAFLLSRIFTRPIMKLKTAAEHIGKGDFDYKIEIKTADEIQLFADSFAKMVANIKQKQHQLHTLNRTLSLVTDCNQVLVRAITEQELLYNICQAIVDIGGYRFAWVGLALNDENKSVEPIATAGFEDGYLNSIKVSWADNEFGRGPTGAAMRSGKPSICGDIATDPNYAPWREEALKRGYTSSIALPLITDSQRIGALNIYSGSPDAFRGEEVYLLAELAGDLAYGIEALRARRERTQAQEMLRRERDLAQQYLDIAGIMVIVLDRRGRVTLINKKGREILGYSQDEILGRNWFTNFIPQDIRQQVQDVFSKLMSGEIKQAGRFENYILTKSGQKKLIAWDNTVLREKEGRISATLSCGEDITEDRRVQEEIITLSRVYSVLAKTGDAIIHIRQPDKLYEEICRICVEQGLFKMAWIGFFDTETQMLLPKAHWGFDEGYLESVRISAADIFKACGIARETSEVAKYSACNDIENLESWNKEAIKRGYKSAATFPLFSGSRIVGALNLYSGLSGFFGPQEIRFLESLAGNLSFAISAMEQQEQKNLAEKSLQKSEEEYRRIVETSQEGIWVIDEEGFTKFVNKKMAQMLGYSLDEMRGAHLFNFMDEEGRRISEEKLRERRKGAADQHEFKFLRKDGSELWALVSASPTFDKDGNYAGSLGMVTDITLRRHIEQDLRSAVQSWHATFAAIGDAVCILDAQGNITQCNKVMTEFLGREASDIVGKPCWEVVHGTPQRIDACPFLRTRQSLKRENTVFSIGEKYFEATIDPIIESGRLSGAVHIISDITERRRLERIKDEFIETVSHELRTPLSIIKESVSLVADGLAGKINKDQQEMLVAADTNIDRLTRIINRLLDISKIESGKVEIIRQALNLVSLAREAVLSFEHKAREKNLDLKLSFSSENISAYIDEDRIAEVFVNLIENAIKFTPEGHIAVSVMEKEKEIECSVQDSGLGISKDNLPFIFEKFKQFGRMAGPGEKGTGLGLSITRRIIELHGGRIWAESELGRGTKITFTLPREI